MTPTLLSLIFNFLAGRILQLSLGLFEFLCKNRTYTLFESVSRKEYMIVYLQHAMGAFEFMGRELSAHSICAAYAALHIKILGRLCRIN